MKIKLGIIGFGGMGKWHAQNAPRAGVEVIAVCDNEELKQSQAIEMGYKLYKSADELLAQSDIITLHAPASEANYHILNQKRVHSAFRSCRVSALLA